MNKGRLSTAIDWPVLLLTTALCGIGLVLLYSAGFRSGIQSSPPMVKQAFSMGIGAVGFFACMLLPPSFWRRWSWALYLIGVILLAAILVTGVVAGGSRRWLDLGGIRMQPSEFMKVALIVFLAKLLARDSVPEGGLSWKDLILPALVVLLPMGLIVVEPDLGTASSLGLIAGSMLLLAGIRGKTLISMLVGISLLLIPGWNFLEDYQKNRVLSFMSPESDPLGGGYHALQSKIAVGSGQIFGKGFFEGTQTQLRFLPEQTTDFIFSVLAEEWGFVGSMTVISLYGLLLFRILTIAGRAREKFQTYLAFGVAAMLFWHILINIAMVLGSFPVVGLTLPLLSYGGSSVVTVMLGLGLVASVSRNRFSY